MVTIAQLLSYWVLIILIQDSVAKQSLRVHLTTSTISHFCVCVFQKGTIPTIPWLYFYDPLVIWRSYGNSRCWIAIHKLSRNIRAIFHSKRLNNKRVYHDDIMTIHRHPPVPVHQGQNQQQRRAGRRGEASEGWGQREGWSINKRIVHGI